MPQGREWFQTVRARYTCYGILCGGCFPLVATWCELRVQGLPFSPAHIWNVQAAQPFLWIIDTAPLFLGWLSNLAGKQLDSAHQLNKRLEQRNAREDRRPAAEWPGRARRCAAARRAFR